MKQTLLLTLPHCLPSRISSLLVTLFLAACTVSQFTLYKPSEDEAAWRVTVDKKPGFADTFVCIINDSAVVEESFTLFGSNFEKDGSYRAKPVKMSGYRTTHVSAPVGGQTQVSNTYQIRVFIEDKEIAKFDY